MSDTLAGHPVFTVPNQRYLKLNSSGDPTGFGIYEGNLRAVLSIDAVHDADLETHGYVRLVDGSISETTETLDPEGQVTFTEIDALTYQENLPVVARPQAELVQMHINIPRDFLLNGTDWTQGNDSPLTDAKKALWATYRQELRDMPQNHGGFDFSDISLLAWPTAPE